jgi:hypothetical protein
VRVVHDFGRAPVLSENKYTPFRIRIEVPFRFDEKLMEGEEQNQRSAS